MKKLLIILFLLLFCILFFFILFVSVIFTKKNKNTNIKTFVLNKKNKKIIFFDHENFKKIETLDLEKFLNFYGRNINLIEWINKKLKKNEILKIKIFKKNIEKIFVFKVFNVEKEYIYFDCYSFSYLITKINKKGISLNNFISNYNFSGFVFNFYFKDKDQFNNKIDIIVFLKLKEIILSFFRKRCFFEKNNELIIFYFKNKSYEKIKILVEKVINLMYCFLKIEGYKNISIAVGIVDSKKFKTIEKLVNKAEKLALKALRLEKKIEIYDDSNIVNYDDYIFVEKNMFQLFWCFDFVFDVVDENKIGLLFYIKSNNKNLEKKVNTLLNFSIRNNKKNKILKIIFKKLIKLINFKDNFLLFCDYYPNLIDFCSLDENNNFVFCFNKKDIDFYIDNKNLFLLEEAINKIKTKNNLVCFKLDLTIENLSILSLNKLISKFDYFILDLNRLKSSWYKDFKNIVELLLSYKKPIIVNCHGSWHVIKFVVSSGIRFIINPSLNNKENVKIRKIIENIDN